MLWGPAVARWDIAPCSRAPSIPESQRVAQDAVAPDSIDRGFTEPSLATKLTSGRRLTGGHRLGERVAQIEIAADTFIVKAIEEEYGLRVGGVSRVLDLAVPADLVEAEV
jgi:hypothetical protein